jgi:hypothetical protein
MHGTQSATHRSGQTLIYYVCPTQLHKPEDKARWPGYARASVREDLHTAKLGEFLDQYALGYDRAARPAELIPASQAQQDNMDHDRAQALTRKLKKAETAMTGIAAAIGALAGKIDPVNTAIRDRLTQRYDEKTSIQAELQAIQDAASLPDSGLTLLDELPYAPGLSPQPPTTCANVSPPRSGCKPSTGQTSGRPPLSSPSPTPPAIIAAILTDLRLDDDTATNRPSQTEPASPPTSGNASTDVVDTAME